MLVYFPRDAILSVVALSVLLGVVALGAAGKTIDRTYTVADCVAAYQHAKSQADLPAIDRHLLHWGYRNRNKTFCSALRPRVATLPFSR